MRACAAPRHGKLPRNVFNRGARALGVSGRKLLIVSMPCVCRWNHWKDVIRNRVKSWGPRACGSWAAGPAAPCVPSRVRGGEGGTAACWCWSEGAWRPRKRAAGSAACANGARGVVELKDQAGDAAGLQGGTDVRIGGCILWALKFAYVCFYAVVSWLGFVLGSRGQVQKEGWRMACCKNVKSGCFDERFANYPRAEVMDRHSGCITRLRQKKVLKTVKVSKQKSPSLKFLEIKDLEIKGRLISQPRRCKEVNDVAYVVLTGLKHCWCKAAGTCMHCASPRQ